MSLKVSRTPVLNLVVAAALGLAAFQPIAVYAKEDPANPALNVKLEQWRINKDASGKEVAAPVAKIIPGDVLEYRVTYVNVSKAAVNNLALTLPIPAGLNYQGPRASESAPQLASTDGTSFQPIPLKRKVKAANGKEVEESVPLADYRALRWPVGQLIPGGTVQVSARAQVKTN
jgi:uncharacterized repeat protein (TIGR01451 family)